MIGCYKSRTRSYSGTSLLRTSLGQLKMSQLGVLISGVVLYTTLSSCDPRQCPD